MGILAMSSTSVVNVLDGVGISSSIIEYAVSSSGTQPPGNPITDGEGNYILDNEGKALTDGEWSTTLPSVPEGQFLWTRTRLIRSDGTFDIIYTLSQHGSTGATGATITNQKEQYYLSSSPTQLTGGTWGYEEPNPIPTGKYLWGRFENIMSDGTVTYSTAVYRSTISGVINLTNEIDGKITQKIWQSDIDSTIEDYDNPTGTSSLRDRVTQTESDISGINTTISNVQSTLQTKADGSTVTTLTNQVNSISDTVDSHTQTISSTNTRIDNLKVGTRNMLKESDIPESAAAKGLTVDYQGNGWFHIYGTVTGSAAGVICLYGSINYTSSLIDEPGEYIISISGDINANSNLYIQVAWHSNSATSNTISGSTSITSGNTEKVFTLPAENHISRVALYMTAAATGSVVDLHIRVKLEKGNKSTDWTPAPEDYEAQISYNKTIAEQTKDRFSWIVQDGSTQSSVQYTANALTAMANQIDLTGKVTFNSMDSTLQNRVSTAESNASTAASDAASAVSTANTANTNASNAVSAVNNSIKSTTMHYLATSASSGVTRSTSGWTTTIQNIDATKRYLWTYQTITKVNDTTTNTDPVISGVWGNTGTSVTVSSNVTTYQVGTSGTTAPTGTWQSTIPAVADGQFLWTRVVTTFSDNTTATSYSVAKQGTQGTSVTVSSTSTTYQSGTSGTTAPTGTWQTTVPTVAQGNYLWTKTVVTYSDGKSTTSYAVSYQSEDGNNGISVTKVEQLYRSSSSTTAPAAPTSIVNSTSTTYNTWTLAMPTYNASYPYYYTCTQTTYSSGNPTWTTPSRCKAIEDANVTANAANTTANTANTNASNAVSTANTANTNASNAVTTANTANTTANNAATSAATANEKANPGLGMKVNYSTFSGAEPGEVYLHGYTDNVAADVDGYVYWNGVKRTVPKKMINPNAIVPYQTTCYIVLRLSSATATTGTLYMVWHNSGWKYASTPTPSAVGGTWSWSETTDIVLGQFVEPANEEYVVDAYLYNPPRNASHILTTGNNPYQYAKNSVDWVSTNGSAVVTAKNIVDSWKGEAENNVTTINGGLIQSHTILAKNLATDAIMSNNYSTGVQNQNIPTYNSATNPYLYSNTGTFLDLASGNIYSPNFTLINQTPANTNTPVGTYLNGTITATAGRIGEAESSYWEIGTTFDDSWNDTAAIIAHGSAAIETGTLTLSNARLNSLNGGNYIQYGTGNSAKWYDYGLQVPNLEATGQSTYYNDFLFIRYINTEPDEGTLNSDWTYLFRVDKDGFIYENGQPLSARYAAIGDVQGAYVSTTGGTVNGDLTVTGTLTATASVAVKLSTARNLNVNLATTSNDGKVAFDGSANVTLGITGTLGVAHGGTGATTLASGQVLIGNDAGAVTTRAIRNNVGQGALGWTNSTVDNTIITTNTLAYWDGRYQATNNASNIQYVRQGKLGTVVTHDFEEFITSSGGTVNGALTVTDLAAGNLVVNGGATFTNGLTGDLTGNVVGIATYATKVKDSGNNTNTTFAYSKSGLAANWTTSPWFAAWNGYELRAISPANLRTTIGAMPATKTFTQNDIVPVLSKTYTDVIATANDQDNGALYFIKVLPTTYAGSWYIKYHVSATIAGVSAANGSGYEESTVEIYGMRDTYSAYRIWNAISNTSYRPYYYHCFYRAKEAGITGGYGHALGVHLRYSYNPATAANSRTINVEILETSGCTVTLLDEPVKYANWTGTGTTNYNTYTNFDASTQGVTITGDRNDVNYYNRNYYGCRTTYTALYRYQLCLTRKDRSLLPINTVNNSVATNKELTTESFDPFGDILYWASTATYSAGANVGDGWYSQYLADIRFSFNIGGNDVDSTLIGRKPLYLVAVPQTDGSAKLHTSPLAQDLPNTEDGLIYIYLGQVYPDTKPYRLYMSLQHSIYWYKDGAVRPYSTYTANAEAAVKDGSGNVISSTYVKKAGDTMSGNLTFSNSAIGISRPGVGGAYKEGRDKALIKTTTNNTYDVFASMKTVNGSWDIGGYNATNYVDKLLFSYIPDTMYNGTNATPNQIKFNTDGSITASLDGNAATATTATQADHVANSLTIQLNGGSTEGTNKFTYNGSGAKSFNITKSSIGLGNVTNNAQVKGLSSGTTSGHLVTWGSDGYTVADSGITKGNIVKSVASDSDGKLVLTYADDTTSDPIAVQFVASSASSVNIANSLNVGGTAVGSTSLPVYFTNQGKPAVITSLPKSYVGLGNVDNTADANKNVLSATKFTSAQSITLTGDTTGTASSQAGWNISTTTKSMSTFGNINGTDHAVALKTYFDENKTNITRNKPISFWSSVSNNGAMAIGYFLSGYNSNPHGGFFVAHYNNAYYVGIQNGTYTQQKIVTSTNYTDYTVTKTGGGATGNWDITAAKATADGDGNTISSTYVKKAGDTMTGHLQMVGSNLILGTPDESSNDSGDIEWLYGNGNEKMRIYSPNSPTVKQGPYFRIYDENGTSLYSGTLPLADGTGASGTWGINISGNATNDSAGNNIVDTYVKKSGDTITGTLILSRTTDLSGTANNKPALIVGGTDTQAHIEIDSNEIQAKATGTTTAALYINNDGGTIYLGPNITANGTTVTATTFSGTATKLATSSGTSAGARPVWYSYLGDNTKAVYHTEFTYNPSGGVLKATTFDGNATSATKATQDGDGNTISSTYAKLSGATFTGAVTGTSFAASNYVSVNSGNSGTNGGLALYSTAPTNYGIAMRGTSNQGKHGYVQGDWATYFFMVGSTQANSLNRGWIFKNNTSGIQTNVASISNAGNVAFNGSVTVGGNATNTSGCEMVFDSTTNSLNFVFK